MTVAAGAAFGLAMVAAVIDWWAVANRNRRIEHLAKPAAMVALIAAALLVNTASPATRGWFVVALALSLAGDIFLMLEDERFVVGLASFLLAQLAYVAGMFTAGVTGVRFAAGAAIAVALVAAVGRRIVIAVRTDRPYLSGPVIAYIGAISLMLAAAIGTSVAPMIAGAGLFYLSDALLGWNRFVAHFPSSNLSVIVPYHLGQILLVYSLVVL